MDQHRDTFAAAPTTPRAPSSTRSGITAHARARMQQRGIRSEALEALLDFGSERHLHGQDCEVVFFDKKAKRRLATAKPDAARGAERLVRTYAIVGSNGVVVTVGHRFRRVRKP